MIRTVIMLTLAILPACASSPPPEYKVELLRFDADLVGTWQSESPILGITLHPAAGEQAPGSERTTLVVQSIDVRIENGRLRPSTPEVFATTRSTQLRKAYRITIKPPDSPAIELQGTLIEIKGERLIGIQVSEDGLSRSGLSGFVLPIHTLWRVTISNDQLRLEPPAAPFAWAPYAGWIDAADSPRTFDAEYLARLRSENPGAATRRKLPDAPDDKPTSHAGLLMTSDVDRLVQAYEAYIHEPGFWGEGLRWTRVKE